MEDIIVLAVSLKAFLQHCVQLLVSPKQHKFAQADDAD